MISHHIEHDNTTNLTYITLKNGELTATFLNFGARMYEFLVPDKHGTKENIFLSVDNPTDILNDPAQFGALVGPVAGRIKHAEWNGIQLEKNHGEHHLHGGQNGWWNQFWDYSCSETDTSISVTFSLTDTLSGYPGPITVNNTYELTEHAIVMTTTCTSNTHTIVNPTNHVYFNLSGNAKRNIRTHTMQIQATQHLETGDSTIPTGNILELKETGFDFLQPTSLESALNTLPNGIDDAYILKSETPHITLSEEESGRQLTITTDRQAVVVFSTTGFSPDLTVNGKPMTSELGIALETQELPDIVHHPEWGYIDLEPHQEKTYKTTYHISLV